MTVLLILIRWVVLLFRISEKNMLTPSWPLPQDRERDGERDQERDRERDRAPAPRFGALPERDCVRLPLWLGGRLPSDDEPLLRGRSRSKKPLLSGTGELEMSTLYNNVKLQIIWLRITKLLSRRTFFRRCEYSLPCIIALALVHVSAARTVRNRCHRILPPPEWPNSSARTLQDARFVVSVYYE